jgi:Flp pilus assembly protein TadG
MTGPRRRRDDDGVVIVEMALVLPILVVLMLGMFTGALAWNQSQALGQGARIAGRYAATLPLPVPEGAQTQDEADAAWLDALIDQAVAAAEGQVGPTVAGRSVCVAYVDPAASATMSRTLTGASTRTSSTSPCFEDGQGATATRVQVEIERDGHIDTGFYRIPLELRRTAVYRYEAGSGL